MDVEHLARPAAPGTGPEQPTARPAGGGGRGDGGPRVAAERAGPVRIVHVAGEFGHGSADGPRGGPARSVDGGVERIAVDLADLRFCDSTGLHIPLYARIDAEAAGRRLELAGLRPVVARVFAVTGADAVLRIHPDPGTALTPPCPPPPAARPTGPDVPTGPG